MTNVKTTRRTFLLAAVVLATALAVPGLATAQVGTVDPAQHHAWMENAGWLDFRTALEGVTVHPTCLSGHAWSENVGWIRLGVDAGGPYANTSADDYGVNNSPGTLSGYAWSENAGWIHLSSPSPAYGVAFTCPPITVSPATLPAAIQGVAYSQSVTASGGASPYTYATANTLPTDLTLSAAGLVSGTPTVSGSFSFTVTATDSVSCTGSQLVSLAISPRADLSITKTGSPDPVIPGGQLTYTITVTNAGPGSASSVTVSDPLAVGVTFVSAVSTSGSCLEAGGVVTCSIGALALSETATITMVVTAPTLEGTLDNTATVTATETDPNGANNTATATTSVGDMQPASQQVDAWAGVATASNLNRVIEPGETVLVAPGWTNPTGSSVSHVSAASGFASATPGTYTIVDGAAGYGSIAAGTTANCHDATGNCFELGVVATGARTAAHWDATFTETLDTGQAKTWTLHIGASFTDMPVSVTVGSFYHYVETLLHSGTTAGCTATTYCPTNQVSRAQMAMFVARAMNDGVDAAVPESGTVPSRGPYNCSSPGGLSIFTDVAPTASYCRHVHFIASKGVTLGCTATTYCPVGTVSRSQLAMFIARAIAGGDASVPLDYTDPTSGNAYDCALATPKTYFADVPATTSYCKHVHYLWAKTVIAGCLASPPSYCPANLVRRDQMAKFLVNGFGFTLYEP